MRFLVDADLPRGVATRLRERGHEVTDVRDIGLGAASDTAIAAHARANRLCLVSGDFGFADVRNYPPSSMSGIVVIQSPRVASADYFVQRIDEFVSDRALIDRIVGRLAIVEAGRIRLRPR
jgi:hypothetical protein